LFCPLIQKSVENDLRNKLIGLCFVLVTKRHSKSEQNIDIIEEPTVITLAIDDLHAVVA
jgi:hypothetical protein